MGRYTEDEFRALTAFRREQEAGLRRESAEWFTEGADPAKVRFLLRHRARSYEIRALWVLGALFAMVLAGIGWFLGSPLLTELRENRRDLIEEQLRLARDNLARTDAAARALAAETAATLAATDHWVLAESGTESDLGPPVMSPDFRTGLVTDDRGELFRSTDGGATWERVALPGATGQFLPPVMSADFRTGLATGGTTILRTEDGGATWAAVGPPDVFNLSRPVMAADFASGLIAGLGLEDTTILRTADGGATWASAVLPEAIGVTSAPVMSADFRSGLITGNTGAILRSGDGGATWTQVGAPEAFGLSAPVMSRDFRTGLVTGNRGEILRSLDGGITWANVSPSGMKADLVSPVMSADFRTGLVTGWGTILRTLDGGATWASVGPEGVEATFEPPTMDPEFRTGLITGDGGLLLHTEDGGATWTSVTTRAMRDTLSRPAMSADFRQGVLASAGGTIWRTEDGGGTWAQVGPPGVEARLSAPVMSADFGNGVITGSGGTILTRLPHLTEVVAAATDVAGLRAALDALPEHARAGPDIELRLIEREQATRLADLAALEEQLADLTSRLDPRPEERAAAYAAAIAACAGNEPGAEVRTACAALLAEGAGTGDAWWRYLVERIPGAVLLLFLLATLGALYRYNLRMAAFYSGRADALDLMADPADHAAYEAFAAFLGGERVEFKDAKTPIDTVTEIAKTLIERLGPKRGG